MKRLLKGGRVVDPVNGLDGGVRRARRRRPHRHGRQATCRWTVPRSSRCRPASSCARASSTSTSTCASRGRSTRKRWPRAWRRPWPAASRPWRACRTPARSTTTPTSPTFILVEGGRRRTWRACIRSAPCRRAQKGEQLADIAELQQAGLRRHHRRRAPDGHRDADAPRLRVRRHVRHAADRALRGPVAQGRRRGARGLHWASKLGLRGIPGACEALGAERGILLAELTGSAFHVAHMSARQSLRAVRKGKEAGVRVTCEVAPHHFTLTDESARPPIPYDTNTKMNRRCAKRRDRDAMLAGIADGSVDVIATDHAPHHYDEKKVEFDRAPFGIVGLETAVPLSLDRLVHAGVISLPPVRRDDRRSTRRASCACPAASLTRGRGGRHHARSRRTWRCAWTRRRCAAVRRTRRSTAGSCAAAWQPRSSAGAW